MMRWAECGTSKSRDAGNAATHNRRSGTQTDAIQPVRHWQSRAKLQDRWPRRLLAMHMFRKYDTHEGPAPPHVNDTTDSSKEEALLTTKAPLLSVDGGFPQARVSCVEQTCAQALRTDLSRMGLQAETAYDNARRVLCKDRG